MAEERNKNWDSTFRDIIGKAFKVELEKLRKISKEHSLEVERTNNVMKELREASEAYEN